MIGYRQPTIDDVVGMDRAFRAAYNGLNRRHGFAEIPPGPPSPFFAFAMSEEGEGCSVAEENGTIVGLSISSFREPMWFLAYLFVDPACQAAGVGRTLIARALAYRSEGAAVRSLITLAYNPVSQGLYMRHGMLPVESLYVFDAAAADLRQRRSGQSSLDSEILPPDRGAAAQLAAIDEPILEMNRLGVHRYLLQLPGNVCHVFRAGGQPRGYAYVSAAGSVGPVAAASPLSFVAVLETALTLAAAKPNGRISVLLAGSNGPALAVAAQLGMRINLPLLLMASRRFGDLSRYAFHSPGIM